MTVQGNDKDKRRAKRRPILQTFSVFVVIPKKGVHRLTVHDISELGIGFDLDTEGESADEFPVSQGSSLEIRFYLNQSLYIPLHVEVVRVLDQISREGSKTRRVGTQFRDPKSPAYQAFTSFIQMLDQIAGIVVVSDTQ